MGEWPAAAAMVNMKGFLRSLTGDGRTIISQQGCMLLLLLLSLLMLRLLLLLLLLLLFLLPRSLPS